MGIFLNILVQEEVREDVWVFHGKYSKKFSKSDIDPWFHKSLLLLQEEYVAMIPDGVYLEEYLILRMPLRGGLTTEVLNKVLDD